MGRAELEGGAGETVSMTAWLFQEIFAAVKLAREAKRWKYAFQGRAIRLVSGQDEFFPSID